MKELRFASALRLARRRGVGLAHPTPHLYLCRAIFDKMLCSQSFPRHRC